MYYRVIAATENRGLTTLDVLLISYAGFGSITGNYAEELDAHATAAPGY